MESSSRPGRHAQAPADGGDLAAIGTSQELKDELGTTTVRVRVHAADEQRIRDAVAPNVVAPAAGAAGWLEITVQGGEAAVPAVVGQLTGGGVHVDRLSVHPPSLEDVFVRLTGTQIETSTGGADVGKITAVRRGLGVPTGPGR